MSGPWDDYKPKADDGPWKEYEKPAPAAKKKVEPEEPPPRRGALTGAVENVMSMGSGLGSSALGGLAGIAGTMLPGPEGQGARWSQAIQHGGTYQPRTAEGRSMQEGLSLAQKPFDVAGEWAGKKTMETGVPGAAGAAAMSEAGIKSLPMILGLTRKGGVSSEGAIPTPPKYPPGHPKTEVPNRLMDKGYKLTPSMTGGDSRIGRYLEGIGGKIQTRQKLSQLNEDVINKAAAKDLGLEPGTPITASTVKPLLEKYGKLREGINDIKAVFKPDDELRGALRNVAGDQMDIWAHRKMEAPPKFQELIDILTQKEYTPRYLQSEIRNLRELSNDNLTKATGDTQLGRSQKATANALEDYLERQLEAGNDPAVSRILQKNIGLMDKFRQARKMTAKVYDYLESTSELGDVNAPKFARETKDKQLSGEAQDISSMGGLYPKASQPSSMTGGYQPHSALDMAAAAGSVMAGKPSGVLEFLGVRPAAREILGSEFGQKHFARPAPNIPKPPSTLAQAKQVFKNNPAVAAIVAGPYTEAEKERRYQEWRMKQASIPEPPK